MAIPINIEDLLNKRKIESNRIEFKKGWNPDRIYRTICAFANDFDNIGGGYIVVGIEEDERTGIARRPVVGLPIEELDGIQKDMIGYNNKIEPYYMPRIDIQEVDGKSVLVIWAPAGVNRPYNVRERVTAKQSPSKWYVRNGTSTIEAKGEVLDELREMANRTPFDERGNERIEISDISPALVLDYLQTVGSRLANDFENKPFVEILGQMDLLTGPTEHQTLKNVAAMMFCKNPAKFFPTTQVVSGRMRKESQQYDRGAENSRTCPGHDQADSGLYPDECYQEKNNQTKGQGRINHILQLSVSGY